MNEPDIGELGIVLGYMIQNCPKFQLLPHLIDLYRYLIANDKIEDILDYNKSNPNIQTDKVLKLVKAGAGREEYGYSFGKAVFPIIITVTNLYG